MASSSERKYWTRWISGGKDSSHSADFSDPVEQEFGERVEGIRLTRRDFLKLSGLSALSSAILSACWKVPVKKAIPYFSQPEDVTPGVPVYYSTAYWDGVEYATIFVRTREGRPIKIEAREDARLGATSPRIQSALLTIYDGARRRPARIRKQQVSIAEAIQKAGEVLLQAREQEIWLVTPPLTGPANRRLLEELKKIFPGLQHIEYVPGAVTSIQDVHEEFWGIRQEPSFHPERAKVIVGIEADFLAQGPFPAVIARRYGQARKVSREQPEQVRHYQIESVFTLTGSNADYRLPVHPAWIPVIVGTLYNLVAHRLGYPSAGVEGDLPEEIRKFVEQVAEELLRARPHCGVICGWNDPRVQRVVGALNLILGAYTSGVLDLNAGVLAHRSSERDFFQFVGKIQRSPASPVIFWNVNPLFDYPYGASLKEFLGEDRWVISLSPWQTRTELSAQIVIPVVSELEQWNDHEPVRNLKVLSQPVLQPVHPGVVGQEVLLQWLQMAYEREGQKSPVPVRWEAFMKQVWTETVHPYSELKHRPAEVFWQYAVRTTEVPVPSGDEFSPPVDQVSPAKLVQGIHLQKAGTPGHPVLVTYQDPIMGTGVHANNAYLAELPQPLTRATWGPYLMISPRNARKEQIEDGKLARIEVQQAQAGTVHTVAAVLVMPGQPENVYAYPCGWGDEARGKIAQCTYLEGQEFLLNGSGIQDWGGFAFRTLVPREGYVLPIRYLSEEISIQWMEKKLRRIPRVQPYPFHENRPHIRETTLSAYRQNPESGNEVRKKTKKLRGVTLYPEREFPAHHWDMVIDLTLCIGCGACVAACNTENNIAVVGPREVARHHEMHWIRIDRYFAGENEDNPDVVYQPMLCQHCDNAPCENVCPVAATASSPEGINQMAYNRCIGTRYCMNNCPYKVRRFNWYDYTGADSFPLNEKWVEGGPFADPYQRLALNPDVVVRSRGVMEKCTFCIQRIQEAKLQAKGEGRPLRDGDVKTACQVACPTGAIQFGDGKDENTYVGQVIRQDERVYYVLEELHTLPSVAYLVKIRNREELEPSQNA